MPVATCRTHDYKTWLACKRDTGDSNDEAKAQADRGQIVAVGDTGE